VILQESVLPSMQLCIADFNYATSTWRVAHSLYAVLVENAGVNAG
jgi:hypothetical protein